MFRAALQPPTSRLFTSACSSTISSRITYQHQQELAPLPVPTLKDSCELYLKSIRPVVRSAEEFERSKQHVEDFLQNQGPVLQQRLLDYASKEQEQGRNWLEKWWLDMAYLSFRAPLPTNSNYYILFEKQRSSFTQIEHATHLIQSALEFKELLDSESLKPDYLRKTIPQCMDQYKKLFTTSRIGIPEQDQLIRSSGSKHIIVICKGQFFAVEVTNGQIFSFDAIHSRLQEIVTLSSSTPESSIFPVGSITAIEREESSNIRKLLSVKNKPLLDQIDTALFSISLDQDSPSSLDEAGEWLNSGNKTTSLNRWYENLINFVVFKNGYAGVTGEHSPLDAPIVGVVANSFIQKLDRGIVPRKGPAEIPPVRALSWDIDAHSSLHLRLQKAAESASSILTNCELKYCHYVEYGTDWVKKVAKCSPDAFVQMSIQLAYYYTHNDSVSTYETGTSRAFYHGRTETVRTLSEESKEWTASMKDASLSNEEKRNRLRTAIDSHSSYMKRVVAGKGLDRHFLGLRLVKEAHEDMPALFKDPVWQESTRFRISTSNMSSPFYVAGFGPTEEDGYGICYQTRPGELVYSITSFRSCSQTASSTFRDNLSRALTDIRALFAEPARL